MRDVRRPKYVLHPGETVGGAYVGARALANLYGVSLAECVIAGDATLGLDTTGMRPLYPRDDGKYERVEVRG